MLFHASMKRITFCPWYHIISYIFLLFYSSVIYNKCFASSSFSPETRSPPVSPAKSPEICPAHRPEVLLVFSENQTF